MVDNKSKTSLIRQIEKKYITNEDNNIIREVFLLYNPFPKTGPMYFFNGNQSSTFE